jgi:hypothetical protein
VDTKYQVKKLNPSIKTNSALVIAESAFVHICHTHQYNIRSDCHGSEKQNAQMSPCKNIIKNAFVWVSSAKNLRLLINHVRSHNYKDRM